MILKLTNNLTKLSKSLEVSDKEVSPSFFVFDVQLDGTLPEGEYSYSLMQDDSEKASGLIQIGNYKPESKEYNNDTKEYKVYGE